MASTTLAATAALSATPRSVADPPDTITAALRSEPNPAPGTETSLATTRSTFFGHELLTGQFNQLLAAGGLGSEAHQHLAGTAPGAQFGQYVHRWHQA